MARQEEAEGSSSRKSMVESSPEVLKKVVDKLDMEYLRNAANSEPDEKCLSNLVSSEVNIFHIAASKRSAKFVDQALELLRKRPTIVQSLLSQQEPTEPSKKNPLHIAAEEGSYKIVKLILDYYRSSDQSGHSGMVKPWLAQDNYGRTPLHAALERRPQQTAMEILLMDVELLSDMRDGRGQGPLYLALKKGFALVAQKILDSAPNCDLSGDEGRTALFYAPNCTFPIFCEVVAKDPNLLLARSTATGETMLHNWVKLGKVDHFISGKRLVPRHKRLIIDLLVKTDNAYRRNPLHYIIQWIPDDLLSVEIAHCLVAAYKQRDDIYPLPTEGEPPWLARDSYGKTPLHMAIEAHREQLAHLFFELDPKKYLRDDANLLVLAVDNECSDVARTIMHLMNEDQDLVRLLTLDNGQSALHCVPKFHDGYLLRLLLNEHANLMEQVDENGVTVLHSWMKTSNFCAFLSVLKHDDTKPDVRSTFIRLVTSSDQQGRNPLHYAATFGDEGLVVEAVELLLNECRTPDYVDDIKSALKSKDYEGYAPLRRAISTRREKLALCFLSAADMIDIAVEDTTLFEATEYECHGVVKHLLEWVHYSRDKRLLRSNGQNILHIGSKCTGENCAFVLENFRELINEPDDMHKKTPLDEASEAGASWLVELILEKEHSSILEAPKAWVGACEKEKSDIPTLLAFIDRSPHFRFICRKHRDTPLHHLKGLTYTEYQRFLEQPLMNELKNMPDVKGKTPLHKAIEKRDKDLAEVLLAMTDVHRNPKDEQGKTAMDLLKEALKEPGTEWEEMCERVSVDPYSKTPYIQPDTDLTEMRSIISVVAALLATITFTAGFTLPGGLDSSNGEATLVKKAAFLIFLLVDTYAMCCSMLVLFCMIWSMICERNRSELLIDRSLVLLKHSLYGTLLAFMTGVYNVIHHKALWAAIVIFSMCSLVIISTGRTILHGLLSLLPAADEEDKLIQLWHCLKRLKKGRSHPNNEIELQETTPFNDLNESRADSNV